MVTRAVNNSGNFTIGPSTIYLGDYDVIKDNASEIGLTQGGVSFNKTSDFLLFDDADQYKGAVGAYPMGEALEITFTIAENTLENLALAWDIPISQLTEPDNEITFGGNRQVKYRSLFVDGPAPGGGISNWVIHKTIVTGTAEVGYTKDDKTLMEITLTAILDLTKTEGQQYGKRTDTYDDVTSPSVASISPTDAGADVAVDTTVEWTFSEAIQQRDITTGNFNLVDASTGTEIAGELTYAQDTFTVIFTPDASLSNATEHHTFASGEVRDLAGNEMGDNYRTTFTTIA